MSSRLEISNEVRARGLYASGLRSQSYIPCNPSSTFPYHFDVEVCLAGLSVDWQLGQA